MYLVPAAAVLTAALTTHHSPVTVQPGDTLSALAARWCGNAADYPALAAASGIGDPNKIYPGRRVTIDCTAAPPVRLTAYSPAARAAPARQRNADARGRIWGQSYGYPNVCGDGDGDGWDVPCGTQAAPARSPGYAGRHRAGAARAVAYSTQAGGAIASSSFEQCVITRESGGQTQVTNASGHWGLYQFSAQTWASAGGNPALFGRASAGYQHQVFRQAYAMFGTQPWQPSDGCH